MPVTLKPRTESDVMAQSGQRRRNSNTDMRPRCSGAAARATVGDWRWRNFLSNGAQCDARSWRRDIDSARSRSACDGAMALWAAANRKSAGISGGEVNGCVRVRAILTWSSREASSGIMRERGRSCQYEWPVGVRLRPRVGHGSCGPSRPDLRRPGLLEGPPRRCRRLV